MPIRPSRRASTGLVLRVFWGRRPYRSDRGTSVTSLPCSAFWGAGLVVVGGGMTDGRAGSGNADDGSRSRLPWVLGSSRSRESSAPDAYKRAVVESSYTDIICTDAITGAWANMLVKSLTASGLDPDRLRPHGRFDLSNAENDPKPWRDLWSAGHGVGAVAAIEGMTEIYRPSEEGVCGGDRD